MRLSEVIAALADLAPLELAESWDNVGLLVGDRSVEARRALFAIDLTASVLDEAIAKGCALVVCYHPPIFAGLKRISSDSLIFKAIASRVALYAPHTALDVAAGGTNDVLGDIVGMGEDRKALKAAVASETTYKLVTFVPESACEAVSGALFEAGAGVIGKYSSCSFRSSGTGTFFGEEGARPVLGQAGALEAVPELRLETVVPIDRAADVVRALRATHPYEEPAFDLVKTATPPSPKHAGLGRVGSIAPVDKRTLLETIKRGLGVDRLLVAGSLDGTVTRVAVAAGSCGELFKAALAEEADVYLTGEMRHHDALVAGMRMTVVCALHSNSERAALKVLAARLQASLAGFEALVSETDRDPFVIL